MKYPFLIIIIISIFVNPLSVKADQLVLAGGCFWCLEHDLENINGIKSVESGYSGGYINNPTYENHDGHQEVVVVNYDLSLIKFSDILRLYLRNIDPLDANGQFCDRGDSYRPVIFFNTLEEEEESKKALELAAHELEVPFDRIKVELKKKGQFWIAEDYHQNFADKNELKYKFYRFTCGRDQRLDQLWGQNARTINEWKG